MKKQKLVLKLSKGAGEIRSRSDFEHFVNRVVRENSIKECYIREKKKDVKVPGLSEKVPYRSFDVIKKKGLFGRKLIVSAPYYPNRFDSSEAGYSLNEDRTRSHVIFETPLNSQYHYVNADIVSIANSSEDLDLVRFVSAFYKAMGYNIADGLFGDNTARAPSKLEQKTDEDRTCK